MVEPYRTDSSISQPISISMESNAAPTAPSDTLSCTILSTPTTSSNTLLNKKIISINTSHSLVSKCDYNIDSLVNLCNIATSEKIEQLLNAPPHGIDSDILSKTFSKIEIELEDMKDELEDENNESEFIDRFKGIYSGKDKDPISKKITSYNFSITQYGDLLIGYEFLAKGGDKKVKKALNIINFQHDLVQHVIRSENKIKRALREQKLLKLLSVKANAYINKPSKTGIHTKTSKGEDKYIFFETRKDGDLSMVSWQNVRQIVQYIHDFASGLAFLHLMGYLHSDVKSSNGLIQGNRAIVADLGMFRLLGFKMLGGTIENLPPECLNEIKDVDGTVHIKVNKTCIADPSIDSYSLGATILYMLCPRLDALCQKLGSRSFGLLSNASRRAIFHYMKKHIKSYIDGDKDEKGQEEDIKIREQLILIAQQLLGYNSSDGSLIPAYKRLSCADAPEALAKITKIDTSPPAL